MRLSLVLAAILLAVPLAATAASPPPAPTWSPATPPAAATAFDASADGRTIVVGLGSTSSGIGGGLPGGGGGAPPRSDLVVYDFDQGLVWNTTCNACVGRTAVATSANGQYIATGTPSSATSQATVDLWQRTGAGSAFQSKWSKTSSSPVYAVEVSSDAGTVAALVGANDATSLIQYTREGEARPTFPAGASDPVFKNHVGRFHVLAVSADGAWVAIGGRHVANNVTQGVVYLFAAGDANPRGFAILPSPVTSLAVTRDASTIIAGTATTKFAWITRISDYGVNRVILDASGAVRDVDIAEEAGALIAVADANGVSTYVRGTSNLTRVWSSNLTGGANDVEVSADGRTLVAASPAGGLGFTSHLAEPLYTLAGARSRVALSTDGVRVVFATNTSLEARRHAPALTLQQTDARGVPLIAPAAVPVDPGERVTFLIGILNNGTAADRGDIILPASIAATANRTAYETRPGERWLASITLTPPATTLPDTYDFTVRAVSAVTGQSQNITLQYGVGAKAGIALQYAGRTAFVARAGQEIPIDFGVANLGNDGGTFTLRATQAPSLGGSWPLTLTPDGPSFVGRQGSATARLVVKIPSTVRDGTSNDIRLVAVLANTTSIPIDLSFLVNPIVAVNLTSDAFGRLVTPGNAAWFNLTLKNTGSVDATFHVTWDPVASSPVGVAWNSAVTGLDTFDTVVLKPGEKRALQVKLFSPQSAQPGNVGTLHMYAKDVPAGHERVKVTQWLNLSATVVPRDLVGVQDNPGFVIPGPSLAILAVGAAAAGVLSRRRSA